MIMFTKTSFWKYKIPCSLSYINQDYLKSSIGEIDTNLKIYFSNNMSKSEEWKYGSVQVFLKQMWFPISVAEAIT